MLEFQSHLPSEPSKGQLCLDKTGVELSETLSQHLCSKRTWISDTRYHVDKLRLTLLSDAVIWYSSAHFAGFHLETSKYCGSYEVWKPINCLIYESG